MSLTMIVTVIDESRERTGFGLNVTSSTISRSPFGTSVTSIDLPPRLPRPEPTRAVCVEIAEDLPRAFFPVTLLRIVELASASASLYVSFVAPPMFLQAFPSLLQRCHWYW